MNKVIFALALAAGFSTVAMGAAFKGYIIDEKFSSNAGTKGNGDWRTKCIKGGGDAGLVPDPGNL